ncbi:MAG: YicC family protein [Oscillospiraceae bacterium]|nr:YicC family protein [Oscillospiraceae bacterium]MDD6502370.1 YicC family protein [Oscillospiraceae bacterium]MDY4105161.1 YicC/YloC family endoribonuclease [Oscillospiraceae bacterium]
MIRSMTGYGGAKGTVQGLELSIELKSVNNRFLDTSVRLPRTYLFAEEAVKAAVQRHISRGKVDVFVTVESAGTQDVVVKVNEPLLRGYLAALQQVSVICGVPNDATAMSLSRMPDVLTVEKAETDQDAVAAAITEVLEQALGEYDAMREREGEKLREDIASRVDTIERLVTRVEEESPRTVADYKARLEQKMREVLETAGIEESRILTEAAIFADKVAVDEETVRLRSHMAQMREMLAGDKPVGRKLDFLVQEMNREANTIGSKCQNADIAHVVVDIKAEIEKIREQVQNIE